MAESGFKGLKVWQQGMALAKDCYRIAAKLPTSEQFGLANQIRRAAVSVPSNIAEGYGRRNSGDYARCLRIAKGSLNELETQLILVSELEMTNVGSEVFDTVSELGLMLSSLISKVNGIVREDRNAYGEEVFGDL
jgi:four helix bundle protein